MITFNTDFSYCPKGHEWRFIPSSTLYGDIFWCEQCDCFYYPSVKKLTKENLNKEFYSDRAEDLIKRAKFLQWKDSLNYKDWEKHNN